MTPGPPPPPTQELKITDLISYLNTNKKVFVLVNGEWLESIVLGIDIPNKMILVDVIESETRNLMWKDLYFQLNKHHPKIYRVKLTNKDITQDSSMSSLRDDKLKLCVKKYGIHSDFMREYHSLCAQLRYDELDAFLDKWIVK